MSTELDARYGRTAGRRLRQRWIAIGTGAAVVVVVVAWVVWVGLFGVGASIETNDVGYRIVSAHEIEVTSQVSADPGTRVNCSIQALNEKHAIVGWKVVELPAATNRTRVLTERLRTSEPAVNGLIGSCWLP
ncbi:DUF4307 domain-containing protein [Lysinimonas soli]|uniref:DUF4307 domain-containing protein n=1 Tax=Lysinimonas soli TaxID=1074233 RepID=A0ABW0NMY5_9MICO